MAEMTSVELLSVVISRYLTEIFLDIRYHSIELIFALIEFTTDNFVSIYSRKTFSHRKYIPLQWVPFPS